MIKLLKISAEDRKKIEAWASDELTQALIDRSDLEGKWKIWRRNFEGKPEKDVKNFPFEKASNIVVPITSITLNTFAARQYNTIIQVQPPWTVTPLNDRWVNHALPTQNLFTWAWRFVLKMPHKIIPWIYDTGNMGTGFFKQIWISERVGDKRYSDDGSVIKAEIEVDEPIFIPIPIDDILFQINSIQDLQKCQWVAHRFRLRWNEIQRRGKKIKETGEPIYVNIEELESFYSQKPTKQTESQEETERLQRSLLVREHELFEVWADYDYDNDGDTEKVCFTFHNKSGNPDSVDCTLIRAILNPYNHRLRPIFSSQCFPRAHRIYGIGYGQKLELLHQGLTTQANQAIDNSTIANAKVVKYKRGSGIKSPLKLYAGKAIAVSDMADIDVMGLGDIYPSAHMIFGFLQAITERESGVADYQLGRESGVAKTGATATSTLALIQEGTKIFDFILQLLRLPLNEQAYCLHSMYSQFKPVSTAYSVLGSDGKWVEQTWTPANIQEDVRKGMIFDITASSSYVNQALERQSLMDLFNLIMGYYMKLFEVAQLLVDPAAPPQLKSYVGKLVESGQTIMERIVAQWNIKDVKRVLASPEDLISLAGSVPYQPEQPGQEEQVRQAGEVEKLKGQQLDNAQKQLDLIQGGRAPAGREGVASIVGGMRR